MHTAVEYNYMYNAYIISSDESEPSWLEPGLKLNNFQLGSASDLFHSARIFFLSTINFKKPFMLHKIK